MRRGLTLILLMLTLAGCSGGSSVIFSVALITRGGNGHQWSGAVSDDNGTRSVDDHVPSTTGLAAKKGSFVGATVQKHDSGNWELTACIAINSIEKRCGSTTAEFGVVSVSGTVNGSGGLD
jgi:hypothetical protein